MRFVLDPPEDDLLDLDVDVRRPDSPSFLAGEGPVEVSRVPPPLPPSTYRWYCHAMRKLTTFPDRVSSTSTGSVEAIELGRVEGDDEVGKGEIAWVLLLVLAPSPPPPWAAAARAVRGGNHARRASAFSGVATGRIGA